MEHSGLRPGHDDPYGVLGVAAGASRQDIARAYRRAVQGAHPDAQPEDPQASARFRALTDAYDLLSDAGRRAAYDREHPGAATPGTPPPRAPRPGTGPRRGGSPGLAGPPHRPLIWAGPVHVEPPAAGGTRHQPGPPAAIEDPAVILGVRPAGAWGWAWW
jgi:hypothetical protein